MENKRLEKLNQYQDSRDLPRFSTMIKARGGYYLLSSKRKVFYSNKKISKLCKLYIKPRPSSFSDFFRRNRSSFVDFPETWHMVTPTKNEVFVAGSKRPDGFDHVISLDATVLYGNIPKVSWAPAVIDTYRPEIGHPIHHLGSGIGCIMPPVGADMKWLKEKLEDRNDVCDTDYYKQNLFWYSKPDDYSLDSILRGDLDIMSIDQPSWHEAQAKYNKFDYLEANMKMAIKEIEFQKLLNEPTVLPTLEDLRDIGFDIKLLQPHISIDLPEERVFQIAKDRHFKDIVYDNTKEEDSFFKPKVIPKILK